MILETAARNAMADAFGAQFASGSAIQFRTSANDPVATLPLNATPFSAAASGKITANPITADSSAAGGTIAKAVMLTSGASVRATLTVSTTAGDVVITTLNIAAGSTVSMSSLEFTMPAS